MTSGITSNVQAQTPNGNFNSSKVESKYIPKPKQVPVTEGVLPLPSGAGLYYWDTGGEGPVVLLSHLGRGSALTWPYQQPVFAKAGFRTIAYSRRGFFGSPPGLKK